jgi:lysine 6-dehydrogenase
MRMLVLGAGQQGSACAFDLLTHTADEVTIADLHVDELLPFLTPFLGERLTTRSVDARDPVALREAMSGATATMNALPYYFNLGVAEAAVEVGSHLCDLGGNTEIVLAEKALDARARAAGVSIIPDCGLAPGMVNILAEHGIRQLDHPRSVRIMVGGLPQFPEPPLNYQIVYSLEGVLDYYTTLSWILRDGVPVQVEALSEVEPVDFPGVGRLEAFHTAGGLSTMAQRYAGELATMEYKTLRYPGHAAAIRVIRDLGLLRREPVAVNGVSVVPRELFRALVGPQLRRDPRESPDLVALRVEVAGEKDGAERVLRWDLLDRFDPNTGITAMMRTTGFSLAITGALQAGGHIPAGVYTPDEVIPPDRYLDQLRAREIRIEATEKSR